MSQRGKRFKSDQLLSFFKIWTSKHFCIFSIEHYYYIHVSLCLRKLYAYGLTLKTEWVHPTYIHLGLINIEAKKVS